MFSSQIIFEFKKRSSDEITTNDVINLIQKNFKLSENKEAEWNVRLRKIIESTDNKYRISVKFADEESLKNFIRKSKLKTSVAISEWKLGDDTVYILLLVKYR